MWKRLVRKAQQAVAGFKIEEGATSQGMQVASKR